MQSYESVVNGFSPAKSSGSEENVRGSRITPPRAETKIMDLRRPPRNLYGLTTHKASGKKIPKLDLNMIS